jgi:hypothetical protein
MPGQHPAMTVEARIHKELAIDLERNSQILKNLLAREYRRDLDPVARTMIPKALEICYLNSGYRIENSSPDSLKAMLAFMGKLIEDEAQALMRGDLEKAYNLRKAQLRFINTHLKPFIEEAVRSVDSKALALIRDIIDNDIEYLKEALINPLKPPKWMFKIK